MLTNQYNLPDAIVRAVTSISGQYNAGRSDITVTSLIKPPQMVALQRLHSDEIIEDVSDRLWAAFGSAMHHILEHASTEDDIVEKRLFTEVNNWIVSGQFDVLTKNGVLQDYKSTSVWSVIYADHDEWEKQLNLLDCLARLNGFEVNKLQTVAICRDWRNSESRRNPDYPSRALIIDIPMWEPDIQQAKLSEYVNSHQKAREGEYPPCTDQERWYSGEKWAVMKKGRKSALRLLDSKDEAVAWCLNNGHGSEVDDDFELKAGITIEHRPGTYRRCEEYCTAAPWCKQFQASIK